MRVQHIILAFSWVLMSACSGGGGGGGFGGGGTNLDNGQPVATEPSTVSISGTFSKGLFLNAVVQAYELIDGRQVPLGQPTRTDKSSGWYTLKNLPKTSNPVVVLMQTDEQSLMLDESQPKVGGFQSVKPPVGTSMRVLGVNLQKHQILHGNVMTEVAAHVAQSKSWSADGVVVGLALVNNLLGFNPANAEGASEISYPLNSYSLTEDQINLLAIGRSLMQATPGCGQEHLITCRLRQLQERSAIEGNSLVGYRFKDLAGYISQVLDESLLNDTCVDQNQNCWAWSPVYWAHRRIKTQINKPQIGVTVASANRVLGISHFIDTLRNGLNASIRQMQSILDDGKHRLDQMMFDRAGEGFRVLSSGLNNCLDGLDFTCAVGGASIFTSKQADGTYRFEYLADAAGVRVVGTSHASNQYKGTFRVVSNANGTFSISLVGDQYKVANGIVRDQKRASIRLAASGLGLVDNSNDIRLSLDAYDVSIFDELRADQSIRLNLGGGTLQWLRDNASSVGTLTLSNAALTIESSDGDLFKGTIDILKFKQKRVVANLEDSDWMPAYLEANWNAKLKEGDLMRISLLAEQKNGGVYWGQEMLPDWGREKRPERVVFEVDLPNQQKFNLNLYSDRMSPVSLTWRYDNGSDQYLKVEATAPADAIGSRQIQNAKVTSSGPYRVDIDRLGVGASLQANVYQGDSKIGIIQYGVLQLGGMEVSLY